MRKGLPLALMTASGLAVILTHYVSFLHGTAFTDAYNNWVSITFSVAVGLGAVSMTEYHARLIAHRRPTWMYSVIFLIVLYGFMLLGFITGTSGSAFRWLFENVQVATGATVFALLAFMTVSAIYRTFRIRSREVLAFMVAGTLVMLGVAPVGDALVPHWSSVSSWLLDVPVNSGFRAMWLGVYLGSFGVGLRILLGLERGHLSGVR